jgi:hypothetical protein
VDIPSIAMEKAWALNHWECAMNQYGVMCLDSPNRPSHRCQRDASHYLRRFPFLDPGLRTFTRGSWANHPAIWFQMYARDPFRLGVTTSRGGRCSTTSFNFLLNRSTFVRQLPRVPQGRVIFSACLRLLNLFSLPSDSFLSCLVLSLFEHTPYSLELDSFIKYFVKGFELTRGHVLTRRRSAD